MNPDDFLKTSSRPSHLPSGIERILRRVETDTVLGRDREPDPALYSGRSKEIDAFETRRMIGRKVSHYRVLERLGGGGMGEVFKAEDLRLERRVALKFLPPELGEDPVAKERFMQEAKAASALNRQNICTIHDIGETDDGRLFLAMAFYEGRTLEEPDTDTLLTAAHELLRLVQEQP